MNKYDESGERVIRVPSAWLKVIPWIIGAAVGGGSGSWLTNERVAALEAKVSALETSNNRKTDWLVKLGDRIRELERNGGTD